MTTYEVSIEEKLITTIGIEANTPKEAIDIATQQYHKGKIYPSYSDCYETNIFLNEEDNERDHEHIRRTIY